MSIFKLQTEWTLCPCWVIQHQCVCIYQLGSRCPCVCSETDGGAESLFPRGTHRNLKCRWNPSQRRILSKMPAPDNLLCWNQSVRRLSDMARTPNEAYWEYKSALRDSLLSDWFGKMESGEPSKWASAGLLESVTHWWGCTIEMFAVMWTFTHFKSGEWINTCHKKTYQPLWSLCPLFPLLKRISSYDTSK